MFISYAQHAEDVLINRYFGGKELGVYVDVGAYDPTVDSVTRHFYDLGWSGVNVEPLEPRVARFRKERPRDVNLAVAASDRCGSTTFFELPSFPGLSTVVESNARYAADCHGVEPVARVVPTRTLDSICQELKLDRYDFLKIDVEGHEAEVLAGANLRDHRPELVVIEATQPGTPSPTHEGWENRILAADYVFAFFDGLNRYYVAREHQGKVSLLQVPPNPFDEYTTPKLLRLKEPEVRAALKVRKFLLRRPRLRSAVFRLIGRRVSRPSAAPPQ